MKAEQCAAIFVELVKEFNRHTQRNDGENVAGSLNSGLALLQDLLYSRLHDDVELVIGRDSMFVPVSELKTRQAAKLEIAIYQIAESNAILENLSRIGPEDDWHLHWLARLRLGDSYVDSNVNERIAGYLTKAPRARQLAFSDVLARVLPESSRAPLILFLLFPLSVRIATAVALGNCISASELRHQQLAHQPAIADCHSCHGRVLGNGEQCFECGNPLWKHAWLVAE